jgi:hypothetical protein
VVGLQKTGTRIDGEVFFFFFITTFTKITPKFSRVISYNDALKKNRNFDPHKTQLNEMPYLI